MGPRVTAIVLTRDAPHHLEPCLAALRASREVRVRCLVVDNASAAGAREHNQALAARFGADLLTTDRNLGFTGGNNLGIRTALAGDADWIVELNDDTVIDPEALRLLAAALATHPNAAAAAPLMTYASPADRVWWGGGRLSIGRGMGMHLHEGAPVSAITAQGPIPVTFLTGCCIMFRPAALRQLGAFRESYFIYCEDVELSLRYRRAGADLLFVPEARLAHKIPSPEPEIPPHKIVLRDRNRRRMVREHYRWWERAQFTAWFYPTRMIHLLRYAARADWARARAILRGMGER